MYIMEPLDLSNQHIHRRVTRHLKCIISQGGWMILIECRIDGDWKSGSWFFSVFLVLLSQPRNPKTLYKLRRTWYQMSKIAWIKSANLQPYHHFLASYARHSPNMPNTDDTSNSDTDAPFLLDADVSSFSGSGVGRLTTESSQPTLLSIDFWFISERIIWETETHF